MSGSPAPPPNRTWVYISAAGAVFTIIFAALFIAFADRFAFVSNAVYYVILIPLALASAAILFEAMRSRARYRGQTGPGSLEMSGPVVVFAGILAGGLLFANPDSTSSVTIRVYGPEGGERLITHGEIILDLGDDRRTRGIGPDGQVTFTQVPKKFLSGEVNVIPRVARHHPKHPGPYRVSPSGVIELEMERSPDSTRVAGSVVDARGPVVGARINFSNGLVTGYSDENGNFRVVLPIEEGTVVPVMVTLNGRTVYDDDYVVSEATGLRILVNREQP
jgi:hypothetical protein